MLSNRGGNYGAIRKDVCIGRRYKAATVKDK